MRAMLLAAGLGTRLAPLTNTVPKCLVPIAGRPLLDYWIQLLSHGGIRDILINLHYLPEQVRAHVSGSSYSVNISLVHERELLGTGGTIRNNRDFLKGGPGMVIHADNLSVFAVPDFVNRFKTRGSHIEITMMTFFTDTPQSCGIVELDDDGTVMAFHEKTARPPGNLANAAVYIFSPRVVDFIAGLGKDKVDISTEVLPHFLGRINTYNNTVYHRDIGTPESLRAAEQEFPPVAKKFDSLMFGRNF